MMDFDNEFKSKIEKYINLFYIYPDFSKYQLNICKSKSKLII